MTKEIIEIALNHAFRLGQTYWQQADSDSDIQHDKSDKTLAALKTLITNTLTNILPPVQAALQPLTDEMICDLWRNARTANIAFTTLATYTHFARAIEAAHGIKAEKD